MMQIRIPVLIGRILRIIGKRNVNEDLRSWSGEKIEMRYKWRGLGAMCQAGRKRASSGTDIINHA